METCREKYESLEKESEEGCGLISTVALMMMVMIIGIDNYLMDSVWLLTKMYWIPFPKIPPQNLWKGVHLF